MQPELTSDVQPRIDRIPYFPQMPIFPIGGYSTNSLEGLAPLDLVWRGWWSGSFIDQGAFAVSIADELPLRLSKRYAHYAQNQGPLRTYDGREFASLSEAGEIFTQAYHNAKPAGRDAQIITPDGVLISYPDKAEVPVEQPEPGAAVKYCWSAFRLFAPMLRLGNELALYDFKFGPFAGFSMLCFADGVLKPNLDAKPRYGINPVASAIWLQSFPLDEKDERGILVASKFVYGRVLLISSSTVHPKIYEVVANVGVNKREKAVQ
jgi:hypothetical protein